MTDTADGSPTDATTTIADLRDRMRAFVAERDWERFHVPKNLAMSIAIEAAELMEHFQWTTPAEAAERTATHREAIEDELADVCCYVLSLANALDVDLSAAIARKLGKNARKYPASEFRGRFE